MRVLYPGGFDLLHAGHVAALHTARAVAGPQGALLVGVNSDAFMAHYKREPSHPATQRIEEVEAWGIADEVFVWEGPEGQAEQILTHTPDVYVAGTDWLNKDLAHQLRLPNLGWFYDQGISLMYLRRTPGISTSQLLGSWTDG